MAVTEITRQMQSMLKEVVAAPLRERGFKGSFPDLRRVKGDKVELIGFSFASSSTISSLAFSVHMAPVFPGREPLLEGANLDPIRSGCHKKLCVWSAWATIELPGYFPDQSGGFFYYGHVFRKPMNGKEFYYYSCSDKTLRYDSYNAGRELLLSPDETSYRKIALEVKRQMDEMMPQLEKAADFQEWRDFVYREREARLAMKESPAE